MNYPYEVGDLLTITNSTAGPSLDYYYFFYEWVAEVKPVECVSERVGVTVTVNSTSSLQDIDEASWQVMPNPVLQGTVLTMPGLPVGTVVMCWTTKVASCIREPGRAPFPSTGQPVGMRFAPCMTMASRTVPWLCAEHFQEHRHFKAGPTGPPLF